MSRLSTETELARKKEYWEDDFNSIKDEVAGRPIEKLPIGNLRIGKQVGAILSIMLNGKAKYEDVFRETGIGRPSFRLALQKAKRNGMVTADGKPTQLGRWCAIAFKVNAGFIEFCVLADMYFYRCLYWDLEMDAYPKGDVIRRIFKLKCTRMTYVYHMLVTKGHARCRFGIEYRFSPEVLYLDYGLFLRLHEYMEDLIVLKRALQ